MIVLGGDGGGVMGVGVGVGGGGGPPVAGGRVFHGQMEYGSPQLIKIEGA